MVESVRVGTVIAHDKRAASRWASQSRHKVARGMKGHDLEAAIAGMASMYPGHIVAGKGVRRADGHLEAVA